MRTFVHRSKTSKQNSSGTPVRGSYEVNQNIKSIMNLQQTIGNQATQRILRSISSGLKTGLAGSWQLTGNVAILGKPPTSKPDDEHEKEADQVSEQVMCMPECGSPRKNPCQVPNFQLPDSQGQPLPETVRSFFEPRFHHDFSNVRVHTNTQAAEMAESLNAKAFAIGNNIVFGSDQYRPSENEGQKLLAHELTHVVQQSNGSSAVISRSCGGPPPGFVLDGSRIGGLITAGLNTITVAVPNQPSSGTSRQPLINPSIVLRLLSTSNCFLRDAAEAERLYFPANNRRPRRSPPLSFNFHRNPELGSEFRRLNNQISIGVTTLAEVVQSIVHEIIHAIHPAPSAMGEGGRITRIEQGMIIEEAITRTRENRIMEQISASPLWSEHTRQRGFNRSGETDAEIRNSFTSGLPKLTYQEFFIIEEMKNRNRVEGVDEGPIRLAARNLIRNGSLKPISGPNANDESFSISMSQIDQSRRLIAEPPPSRPPTISNARQCIETYNRNRRNLYNTDAQRALNKIPRCIPFIEQYSGLLDRESIDDLTYDMDIRFTSRMDMRNSANALVSWYDNNLSANVKRDTRMRDRAFRFFSWILISEKMSNEWRRYSVPDPELRNHHLDFLSSRIGSPLRGIQRP